jgi:hypothetical protein
VTPPDHLTWAIAQTVASRRFARLSARLHTLPAEEERRVAALLAVEMTARTTVFRAAEWLVLGLGRLFFLPRCWLPRTVGPLQLTDGPFDFAEAVARARELLGGSSSDLSDLARLWNGESANTVRRGAKVSYLDALSVAYRLVSLERRS